MKIRDILNKVNKSKQFQCGVFIGEMANEMGLSIHNYDEQDRITSYYIGNWYCTDSYVGYKVFFFDDKPVAVSSQVGRKMDEVIEWISEEDYKKVREYVLTFQHPEDEELNINLCDLDEEIGETYKINYHSQLFDYHKKIGLLKGEVVEIIDYHKGNEINEKKQYEPSLVKIKLKDKTEEWIELKDMDFPYNTI